MLQKAFHILSILLIFCAVTYAQKKASFVFSQLNESNGLPNNTINCSLQDRDGFIWLGTGDGLIRYDGSHFVVFKSNYKTHNSLPHNAINALFEDVDGKIWLATGYGISYFDKKKSEFVNFSEDNEGKFGRCGSIYGDDMGNIWFSGEIFIGSFSKTNKTFIRYNPNPGTLGSITSYEVFIHAIVKDPINKGIWVSTSKGLNYYDIKAKRFFNYQNNPQKLPILDEYWKGPINILGEKMYYYDDKIHTFVIYNIATKRIEKTISCEAWQRAKHKELLTLLIDRNQNIWLSFTDSSYFIDSTGFPKEIEYDVNKRTSISERYFSAAWQTEDGTIWFGTPTRGISYTNTDKIFYKVYSIPYLDSLTVLGENFESINAFSESADNDGTWWIGTWNKKLIHFEPQKKTTEIYSIPNNSVSDRHKYIHTICDSKDIVYIAVQEGVFLLNKKTKKISALSLPPKIDLKSVFIMSIELQADILWVRTNTTSIFTYSIKKEEWQEFYIPNEMQKNFFTTRMFLGKDKNNDIWVNLYPNGFAKFSKERQQFVVENIKNHQPAEEWFYQFQKDSLNNLWIPSFGFGLVKYDIQKKEYQNWREADGLISDNCVAACPDVFGNVWISSLNKFSIFNPRYNHFQNFTLPYNEGNINYRNYMFPLRNKHILAIQKNYLIEFMPEKVVSEIPKSPALISSLQTPDSTFLINSEVKKIELNATQSNFSINYSVLTPFQEQYKYYYILEGYDENWVAADSKTTANYTKIPGGEYVFKVKTVVNNKSIEGKSLIIEVDTFFYKTKWFLYLILSLIGGLAYAFYRYNVQKTAEVHHLQIQTTRLQKDKTEIQYQNLINHLNPHFLFNSLTSLNSLIAINPKQASKFLKRLSLIYRYILQNKEKELVSLDEEIAFVQNYIDLQKSRFEEGLQISIQIPDEYQKYRIVPVTLQNLLENAIKHNVIEDESPLLISIYGEDDCLIVENNLQKKHYVETSNKQGLTSLQTLYHYLTNRKLEVIETGGKFIVKIPLL